MKTKRHHHTPTGMVKIQNTGDTRCCEDVEQQGLDGRNAEGHSRFGRQPGDTYLASEPAIKILGIYPNELKTYIHTKTYILMFMVALFLTAETWKSPRYPSESEWFIQPTECHAVIKRNELSSHKETWRKHNCIWLSVRIQSERPLTV